MHHTTPTSAARPGVTTRSPRLRRRLAAVTGAAALALTTLGLSASPAAAAPEPYFSFVDGEIAVKGSPSPFSGVTIAGTFDEDTGGFTAQATFPQSTQVREDAVPDQDAEVVIQVSQPEPAAGTISETGDVALDAVFQLVLESVTLVHQDTGARSPLPLGPEPDSCKFFPIEVGLTGTATGGDDSPVTVSVSDDSFVIPEPDNPATDCGPLGALIYPKVSGPAEGEEPNSAELSFTLSSAQAQVEAIYQAVLGRSTATDPVGLEFWSGRLQAGESPTRVASRIARSTEGWRNAVIDSYGIAFDRAPETSGLTYWTEALIWDQDQAFLIGRLLSSPEANEDANVAFPEAASSNQAFVEHLYVVLFGRSADESGRDFWTARLDSAEDRPRTEGEPDNQAVARTQLAQSFYRNTETVRFAVNSASLAVCGVPASGDQAEILSDAFVASNYHTRVLLAVASVTPCPAP